MSSSYEVGPFVLDTQNQLLTRASAPVALGRRAISVFTKLVQSPSECVPKCALIEAAWPGIVVEEGNLAVQISAIRRVLSQVPGAGRWIETLAGRGYRFVGPAVTVQQGGNAGAIVESNLPAPLSSFIGRERDRHELKRLLQTARLTTLVGVGGIGKTRLALELGRDLVGAYRDGVWLVELASIRDGGLVAGSVARSVGIQDNRGNTDEDSLCSYLRSRKILLVFDNCEHLIDACARLVALLLAAGADVQVLATSRESLRVAGEQVYPLSTLGMPSVMSDLQDIERSDAVQLFVDRATAQQPGFRLTQDVAPHVAALCRHLDGIPLALELAAARMQSLSVQQIASRISDRFRLLSVGSRNALPRHQTLRAAFDWSHDLLSQDERKVLRRMTKLCNGFTLEDAMSVASDGCLDRDAVAVALTQLVSRSLVLAQTFNGQARYALLETTRAYARNKLQEVDEQAARLRHAGERPFDIPCFGRQPGAHQWPSWAKSAA